MLLDACLPDDEATFERERLLPLLDDLDLLGLADRVFDGGCCRGSLLFAELTVGAFLPLTGAVIPFLGDGAETMSIPLAVEPEFIGPVLERLCFASER